MNNLISRCCAVSILILSADLRGEDFCFLQVSDIHIEPVPVGSPPPGPDGRSASTIGWFCEQATQPQTLAPSGVVTPRPAFYVCTGDLMEFGAVGKTFDVFESLFKPLKLPVYMVPGNHDNTWAGVLQIFRDKYGGDHYSLDRFGCHFIFFDSATPQEPSPSIEQRTLTFIRKDLAKVRPGTPVFMFCHHPLSTSEYAKPYEQLRFLDAIRGHNVVCLIMGHGHRPVYEKWGTLDSVMGGSTFSDNPKDNISGYNIISVNNGTLRIVYRFRDETRPMKTLLEKSIKPITAPELDIVTPASALTASGETIPVEVRIRDGSAGEVTAAIDNAKEHTTVLAAQGQAFAGKLPLQGLTGGRHYIRFTTKAGGVDLDRAVAFDLPAPEMSVQRQTLDAGMKSAPIIAPSGVIAATTAGDLILLQGSSKPPRVLAKLGAEVLHEPALVDNVLYVGCGNGNVYSIALDGHVNWKCAVGASTYGTPAVDAQRVYAADLQGFVHAIDRRTGNKLWSKPISGYSIEQSMLLHEGVLYFGAWDSFVYAVSAADGAVKWKVKSPGGQTKRTLANRYYSAADASPIVVGDRIVMADRAYKLGAYAFDGSYLGEIGSNIPAISRSEDGLFFYTRGYEGGINKYDAKGQLVWNNPLSPGRYPIPPTERGGKLYVCTNYGLLNVIDAANGKTLWQYQVTPLLPVMAPVSVDAKGHAWVAGMDGTVSSVSHD